MRVALISDVHGNLEALLAVIEDITKNVTPDQITFLGDAVGYGANPNEVLQIIKASCSIRLMGNHDYSALGLLDTEDFNPFARKAIEFTHSVLTPESISILSALSMTYEDDDKTFVHATPDQPQAWTYLLSLDEAERQFAHFTPPACFVGHSHKPEVYIVNSAGPARRLSAIDLDLIPGHRYIVNVGSVGQPRDGDPRACYAVYDSIARRVKFRRVTYDVAKAQANMREANLPSYLIDRLEAGR